ncbi:hypothetical protein N8077_01445 [Myxococcota bacterium]|nr:hypothetical protein [Myxococcota bacterium]
MKGQGEKFSEQLLGEGEPRRLGGKQRTPIEITGSIEKKFFSEDRVFVAIREEGASRLSATLHELSVVNNDEMRGAFRSTIADGAGLVSWVKE